MTFWNWLELICAAVVVGFMSYGEEQLRKRRFRTRSEREQERIARMM